MTTSVFAVSTSSSSASAPRQHAGRLALTLGFSEERAGQTALITSELATNIAKHAAGGEILIQEVDGDPRGIEVFAIDKGPGVPPHAMRDGYSTAGSMGTGFGAIARQADEFEIFSSPDNGTVAVARVWKTAAPANRRMPLTGISVPKSGESVCGDAWGYQSESVRHQLIVLDGLGHGPQAADAATAAMRVFAERSMLPPVDLIEEIHLALRATRGAAVGVTMIDQERSLVRFAGVGNIVASLVTPNAPRQTLASHNGTAGVAMRRIQEFTYPIGSGTVLVMHSDGLGTHWNPDAYVSVWRRDPALAAGLLYRDHTRGRDDCTVVVAHIGR